MTAPEGQLWFGDDAAVLHEPPLGLDLLLCADVAVEGVHADLDLLSPAMLGWRAVAATLSDLAAMGARPWRMVVTACGSKLAPVSAIMEGAIEAGAAFGCPIVGGDISSAPVASVSVSAMGLVSSGGAVTRSGASAGELLFATSALGASAAGLRMLRDGGRDEGGALIEAHRRPTPQIAEGTAARLGGATAMIDVSDGFSLDLHRLAVASAVGVELETLPIAVGATEAEALGGGEDYVLIFSAPAASPIIEAFDGAQLAQPIVLGQTVAETGRRNLRGLAFDATGFGHDVA